MAKDSPARRNGRSVSGSTAAHSKDPKKATATRKATESAVSREVASARTPSRLPKVGPGGPIRAATPKGESKAASQPTSSAASKPATKPEIKIEKRADKNAAQPAVPASVAVRSVPVPAPKAVPAKPEASKAQATKSETAKPAGRIDLKAEPKVDSRADSKSDAKPESKATAKATARPSGTAAPAASVVEPKPDHRPEVRPEQNGPRRISVINPRSQVEQPPVRQLGLRATRPEEVANVRPLEMKTSRAGEGKAPKGSADINGYQAAVRYLLERTDFERMRAVKYNEATFKLDRMEQLLAKLGNPHRQIRTVHVAGTNGKGSTVHMIASMLQACGYTVGVYTSPHLVDLRERILINGQMIEKAVFAENLKQVAKAAEKVGVEPTFFEAVTAVCFKHFAEQAVDIAVVEVGLGGRLDSTNVIRPEACVVTSIDLDHTKMLGGTVEEIAREKAGIFKQGVPAFIFESDPAVEAVMREVAEKNGALLRIVNKDIDYSARFCVTPDLGPHTRVCLYTKTSRLEHLPVPMPGEHQASNCGLALSVIDHLKTVGFDCPEDKITAGLAATRVPGRMQLVWDRPRVLVDGAHNPAAVGALMRCAGAHVPYDSMICVFGCCSDKDVPGLIDKVNLGADKVIFTRAAGNPRSADPEDLQKLFSERSGKMSQVARTLPEALEMATRAVSREDLVCVTGSFYLVGETLKHLQHFDRSKGGKIPAQVPEDA
jgi:dihydrofolate synthase/folylpolyglutamate synthase